LLTSTLAVQTDVTKRRIPHGRGFGTCKYILTAHASLLVTEANDEANEAYLCSTGWRVATRVKWSEFYVHDNQHTVPNRDFCRAPPHIPDVRGADKAAIELLRDLIGWVEEKDFRRKLNVVHSFDCLGYNDGVWPLFKLRGWLFMGRYVSAGLDSAGREG
jgi:hypothetical protein